MKKIVYLFALLLVFASCSSNGDTDFPVESSNNNNDINNDDTNNNTNDDNHLEWLIPVAEVFDGGPGKDGIPSLDNPIFVNANSTEANYLNDDDLIVGVVKGNDVLAYPHIVLDWHEIVNFKIDGEPLTVSYCPLTGTAFGWKGFTDGSESTFGVSGLLYNSNLILYDRNTDSLWSQLKLLCVNGSSVGDEPVSVNVIETDWATWKLHYPNTKVLSLETGFSRNYGQYPYGPYKSNHDFFLFPFSPYNTTLPSKERVYAIIDNDKAKAYQFSSFQNGKLIKESFQGHEYLIIGNDHFINSFKLTGNQTNLNFELENNDSELFFKDNEGNKWDIFGRAIEGPRMGEVLGTSNSVVSFWFAIAAFYPDPVIYSE